MVSRKRSTSSDDKSANKYNSESHKFKTKLIIASHDIQYISSDEFASAGEELYYCSDAEEFKVP